MNCLKMCIPQGNAIHTTSYHVHNTGERTPPWKLSRVKLKRSRIFLLQVIQYLLVTDNTFWGIGGIVDFTQKEDAVKHLLSQNTCIYYYKLKGEIIGHDCDQKQKTFN